MPREVHTQVDTRQVYQPISAPQAQQVVARPTDQLALPIQDPELLGLVRGLATFHPQLQQYAVTSAQVDANRDMKAGAAARQQGKEIEKGSSEWFRHAYMMQDGQVKGDLDGGALNEAYATQFDKDTGNVDDFIREHFKKNTEGLTDQSTLEGYHESIAPHIQKIRQAQQTYQQEAVVQKVESNAVYKLDKAFQARIGANQLPTVGDIEAFRKDVVGNFNGTISNTRVNDLVFHAIDKIGAQGNPDVYNVLFEKKPDGTPGMAYIPEWKEKIDHAIIRSKNVKLANADRQYSQDKRGREDDQDLAMHEAFALIATDPTTARMKFDALKSSGLITRASELVHWEKQFASASTREASVGQQETQLSLQQGIYTGKTRPSDIMNADMTFSQKSALMAAHRSEFISRRQLEAEGKRAEGHIFKTEEYNTGENYIKTVLKPKSSKFDPFGVGTDFERQQQAGALRRYMKEAQNAKDPSELDGIAQRITGETLDLQKNPRIKQELDRAGFVRFDSWPTLQAAIKSGKLKDPIDIDNHIRYLTALDEESKNAPTR